jgi:hypothetical protein
MVTLALVGRQLYVGRAAGPQPPAETAEQATKDREAYAMQEQNGARAPEMADPNM